MKQIGEEKRKEGKEEGTGRQRKLKMGKEWERKQNMAQNLPQNGGQWKVLSSEV